MGIIYWGKDNKTGLSCGINGDGELFLGGNDSGYNLRDTPPNRRRVIEDFERQTGIRLPSSVFKKK